MQKIQNFIWIQRGDEFCLLFGIRKTQ